MTNKLYIVATLLIFSITSLVASPGDHVWSFGFGGTDIPGVEAKAITVDSSNNVIIVGQFQGTINMGGSDLTASGANWDIYVAKYNSSGVHQWSKRFGGNGTSDTPSGVGADSSGNVYVTGLIGSAVNFGGGAVSYAGGSDVFVLKLDSSGNYVAALSYGGTGNEASGGIAVLADGTYAITGSYGNFGSTINFGGGALPLVSGPDYFVAKFDPSGTHLWSKGGGGTSQDVGNAIAMDTSGNVFITGYFTGSLTSTSGPTRCPHATTYTSAGDKDIFVASYTSATGSLSWLNTYGGTSADVPNSLSVGPSGEVVIGGLFGSTMTFGGPTYTNSSNSPDMFLAKYNSGGGWVWDKVFGILTTSGSNEIKGVSIDTSGNVVVTGTMSEAIDMGGGPLCIGCSTTDVIVAKYSSSGTYTFANRYSPPTNFEFGMAIDTDSSNNLYITGYFFDQEDFGGGGLTPSGNAANSSGFVAKFLS